MTLVRKAILGEFGFTNEYWANFNARSKRACAFTRVEILILIGVVVILAIFFFPHTNGPDRRRPRAQLEVNQIANAIHTYESDYGHFPIAAKAASTNEGGLQNFTFGAAFYTPTKTTINVGTPNAGYVADNSEVMAVLMDLETFGNGKPTINAGHKLNPQKTVYLNANKVPGTNYPGVGDDGVYRDPWGNPYVITINVNGEDATVDAFYGDKRVSADPTDPARGVNGLFPKSVGSDTVYAARRPVMVWSAGKDKMIEYGPANQGANKDNIISWSQ